MVHDCGRLVAHPPPTLPGELGQMTVLLVGEPLVGKAAEGAPHTCARREGRTGDRRAVDRIAVLVRRLAEVAGPDQAHVVEWVTCRLEPVGVVGQPDARAG